jgi:5-oxoprolinase (ATP-hydrolysing) subunit A
MKIDLNCDVGEGFGGYRLGVDDLIIPLVSSVNIACGFHAGDPLIIQNTVKLAKKSGCAIGAHPGYPDVQGFGRRAMAIPYEEIEAMVLYQIGALYGFCRAEGCDLVHVKPHGALYNTAAKDLEAARSIARAVKRFSSSLVLVGLAGSDLIRAAKDEGLAVLSEGFPDRGYTEDGKLISRSLPGALLTDPEEIARHAVALVSMIENKVETLCLHGDHPGVVENAIRIRQKLAEQGIEIGQPINT